MMRMPQITCPYCGHTVGLSERREIDHELILGILKSGPKRFTDLYHATHLSRKTLSLRLKELRDAKSVDKKEGYYCLNGAYLHHSGKSMFVKSMGRSFSIATRNLRIVVLVLLWLIPTGAMAYALMTRPAEVKVVSQPPTAVFSVLPETLTGVGWEVEESKIIIETTDVRFDASSSSDTDGQISQYIWNLGDGSSASGVLVTHIYSTPGSYVVGLTVIDNAGLEDTAYRSLTVYAQPTTRIFLHVPENYGVGSIIEVSIVVKDVSGLFGWQSGLTFNPNALECLKFEKGDSQPIVYEGVYIYSEGLFSGTSGATTWQQPRIDNEIGDIHLAGATLMGDSESYSGPGGEVAKITFKVLSLSDFNLKLYDVILCAKDTSEIPVLVGNP